MPENCGLPEGVIHPHVERCYVAGITDGQAPVQKLADDLERDFDAADTVTVGSVVSDIRAAIEAGENRD